MRTLYLSGKYLSQPITGVQRYAAGIVDAWDQGLEEGWIDRSIFAIRAIVPRTILRRPAFKHITLEHSTTDGRTWEQVELPWRARGSLLFSPYAAAPLLKRNHAVTIHDAAAAASPEQYSNAFKTYCAIVFRVLGLTCNPIFTVSNFSKSELERYFSVPAQKLRVVHPGCDHLVGVPGDPAILEKAGLAKHKFVLGVSSQSPVKNFRGLARAWDMLRRSDMKLAIAGKSHSSLFRGDTTVDSDVVRLGYVSDSELRSLYENAALFVYPSFYEGFGIPPIEAMSCGCPVLVSRRPALQEACGDAAAYCNPDDASDIAENIARILDNPEVANTLREVGRHRASGLTASRSAKLLWSELEPFIQV
jgi:glycosyltransferase involved in cell wall biosynthesis